MTQIVGEEDNGGGYRPPEDSIHGFLGAVGRYYYNPIPASLLYYLLGDQSETISPGEPPSVEK